MTPSHSKELEFQRGWRVSLIRAVLLHLSLPPSGDSGYGDKSIHSTILMNTRGRLIFKYYSAPKGEGWVDFCRICNALNLCFILYIRCLARLLNIDEH